MDMVALHTSLILVSLACWRHLWVGVLLMAQIGCVNFWMDEVHMTSCTCLKISHVYLFDSIRLLSPA